MFCINQFDFLDLDLDLDLDFRRVPPFGFCFNLLISLLFMVCMRSFSRASKDEGRKVDKLCMRALCLSPGESVVFDDFSTNWCCQTERASG